MEQKFDPNELATMRAALLNALEVLPASTEEHYKFYRPKLHLSWKKCAVVTGFIFLTFGVGAPIWYGFDLSPPKLVKIIAGLLPVPAVIVAEEIATTRTIQQRVVGLEHFYLRSSTSTVPPYEELRSHVVQRIVRDLIVRNLAHSKNIAISSDELQLGLQQFAANPDDLATLLHDIDITYGWSQDEFEHIVLSPLLLEKKLLHFYQDEKTLDEAVKTFSAQNKIKLWIKL